MRLLNEEEREDDKGTGMVSSKDDDNGCGCDDDDDNCGCDDDTGRK
jgi:hypothetical protein